MNICFISHTARLGGAERVLLETIEILKSRDIECCVLVPGKGELSSRLERLGVPYDIVHNSHWVTWQKPTLWSRMKATVKIAAGVLDTLHKVKRSHYDIIYSNTLTICNGGVAAAILGIPHIWHLHEYHDINFYYGRRFSLHAIGLLSSACITVSKHLSVLCEPFIDSSKLRVIYPAMQMATASVLGDGRSIPAEQPRPFRCVIVGGLFPAKRQEDAVLALRQLQQSGADIELLVVGEGDSQYLAQLKALAACHHVLHRVQFAGPVDDAMPLIRRCDVLLVCCQHEMFGRTTIEAMLAGKPVVGARAAATAELIQDGISGWLYQPGSTPDLAAKIRLLYDNRALARHMGEQGRAWAYRLFTRERYAQAMLALLADVCEKDSLSRTQDPQGGSRRHVRSARE